jgi:dipeptidyl aminopeptidase/acylaminoacyl peptidase
MRWLASVVIVLVFLGAAAVGCRVWDELLGQGQHGLYIIDLDGSGLRRLTGGDVSLLGWLEDNVALIEQQEKLQALDIDSGEVRTLVSAQFVMYRLSPDRQRIAYLALPGATLHVAKADGSEDRILAEGEGLNWFSWSPDSQRLVYNLDPGWRMYVVDVSGDEPARLEAESAFAYWAPCERILFDGVEEYALGTYSIRADGSGLADLGEARWGRSCQPNGSMVAVERGERGGPPYWIELVAIDGSGSLGTLTTGRLPGGSWSPDGSKLAVYRDDGERTLVIVDLETRAEVELVSMSFEEGACWSVCWSPDSQWVAFSAARVTDLVRNKRLSDGGNGDLYMARADGSEMRRLVHTSKWEYGCGWTPDGKRMILRID